VHDVDDNQEATAQSVRGFQAGRPVAENPGRHKYSPILHLLTAKIHAGTAVIMPTAARMLLYLEAITAPVIDLADHVLAIRSGSLFAFGCVAVET
jgi:hypothetical protein